MPQGLDPVIDPAQILTAQMRLWASGGWFRSGQSATSTIAASILSGPLIINGQIQFPATQNPSADPNTLDDYEEGSWTPAYASAAGAFGAITYGADRFGWYTKVGNICHYQFLLYTDSLAIGTASGALTVTGLPFTSAVGSQHYGPMYVGYRSGFVTNGPEAGLIAANTAVLGLFYWASATGYGTMSAAFLTTGASASANFFIGGGSYRVT
jgi:hypothetical protein